MLTAAALQNTGGPSHVLEWATLITAFAAIGAVLVGVIALITEGRRTRLQLGISNLWRLIEEWDDERTRLVRADLAERLIRDPKEAEHLSDDAAEVLNTFELLGYLVRSKTLGLEDAWVNFSGWAMSWWYLYEDTIGRIQEEDPTIFEDYRVLVEDFVQFEADRRGLAHSDIVPDKEALDGFLKAESELPGRLRARESGREKRTFLSRPFSRE